MLFLFLYRNQWCAAGQRSEAHIVYHIYQRFLLCWFSNLMRKLFLYCLYLLEHFSLALTVFKMFTFQISWPWKCRSKSWYTFAVAPYDGKCMTPYLMAIARVEFFQPILVTIVNLKVWLWKYRSMSLTATVAVMPFDG